MFPVNVSGLHGYQRAAIVIAIRDTPSEPIDYIK